MNFGEDNSNDEEKKRVKYLCGKGNKNEMK